MLKPSTKKRHRDIDHRFRILLNGYAATLVTVAGFAWYWLDSEALSHPSSVAPIIVISVGIVWYLAVRIWGITTRWRSNRKR